MAISLPPPLPPQPVELRAIDPAAATLGEAEFRGYRIHVHGPALFAGLPIGAIVRGARSLSDAVYRLGSSANAAGYPAAQALYAVDDHDLHVLLVPGHVTRIVGDRRLLPFFRDTLQEAPLAASTLEQDRALASVHADRLALAVTPVLTPEADGARTLRFDAKPGDGVAALRTDAGNAGNRYVGPWLAGLGGTLADRFGDELSGGVRRGITPLNDEGSSYTEQALRLSRVTPMGALALSGQRVHFRRRIATIDTDNVLWQYGALWLYPFYADLLRRGTIQIGVDRTERTGEAPLTGQTFFAESYTSGQLAATWSRASYPAPGTRVSLDSGLTVRKGFGPGDPALSQADLGYALGRSLLAGSASFPDKLRVRLEASGQWSRDSVPEQQQWVLGGAENLAAYAPGVAVGDTGYGARLEGAWQRPARLTRPSPRLFLEYGRAHLHAPTSSQASRDASAADAGLALDFLHAAALRASVSYAWPIVHHGLDDAAWRDARADVLFTVAVTLK